MRLGDCGFRFLEGGVGFVLIPAEVVLGTGRGAIAVVAGEGEVVRGLSGICHSRCLPRTDMSEPGMQPIPCIIYLRR